jgi:hypothetical protein
MQVEDLLMRLREVRLRTHSPTTPVVKRLSAACVVQGASQVERRRRNAHAIFPRCRPACAMRQAGSIPSIPELPSGPYFLGVVVRSHSTPGNRHSTPVLISIASSKLSSAEAGCHR